MNSKAVAVPILPLGAGLAALAWAFHSQPGGVRISVIVSAACLLGLAAGLFLVETRWTHPDVHALGRRVLRLFLLLASTAGVWLFITHFGMYQFGGFDHSALIDSGWRLFIGQIPFVDFPSTVPPVFYLGADYAFRLFGVSWRALVLMDAWWAAALFLWSFILLRRIFSNYLYCLLLALFGQAACTMFHSFWWHNAATESSGIVLFLSAAVFLRHPTWRPGWLSLALAFVLAAMMKPHVAGILIFGLTAVLLTSPAHRWKVVAISALSLLVFLAWLALYHVSLPALLHGYFGVVQHGVTPREFLGDLHPLDPDPDIRIAMLFRRCEKFFSMFMLVLALIPILFSRNRPSQWRLRALALVAVAAGLEGFYTNAEVKILDLPLIVLGCAVYVSPLLESDIAALETPPAKKPLPWEPYLTVVVSILLAAALAGGAERLRVLAVGYRTFFEYQLDPQPVQAGFFKGLHTSRPFVTLLDETAAALSRHPGARVFCGPRMQWAYAAFGLPSPAGQPIWWHPAISFSLKDEPAILRRWQDDRFDTLLFLGADRTYYDDSFLALIRQNYVPEPGGSMVGVLRLKPKE